MEEEIYHFNIAISEDDFQSVTESGDVTGISLILF